MIAIHRISFDHVGNTGPITSQAHDLVFSSGNVDNIDPIIAFADISVSITGICCNTGTIIAEANNAVVCTYNALDIGKTKCVSKITFPIMNFAVRCVCPIRSYISESIR